MATSEDEAVDLTADESPRKEEADRRGIMAMAALANAASGRGRLPAAGPAASRESSPAQPKPKRQRTAPPAAPDAAAAPAAAGEAPAQAPPSRGANPLMAALAAERRARQQAAAPPPVATPQPAAAAATGQAATPPAELSCLTYNVWFEESAALQERMAAIGAIIEEAGFPDVLMFQEVTHNIAHLWQQSAWWPRYQSSPPDPQMKYFTMICIKSASLTLSQAGFENSAFSQAGQARGVRTALVSFRGHPLRVATTHLESPVPKNQNEAEREEQLAEAWAMLAAGPPTVDVIFGGDMNWTQPVPPPLPDGWVDPWPVLRGIKDKGFTYDGPGNPMLATKWRNRCDRFFVKVPKLEVSSIELVGQARLPGVTFRNRWDNTMPVLPSDHYGVLLRMRDLAPAVDSTHAGVNGISGRGQRLGGS